MGGMASACTGVVVWYFITSAMAFFVLADTSKLANANVVVSSPASSAVDGDASSSSTTLSSSSSTGTAETAATLAVFATGCFFFCTTVIFTAAVSSGSDDLMDAIGGCGFAEATGDGVRLMRLSSDSFRPALGGEDDVGGSTVADRVVDMRYVSDDAPVVLLHPWTTNPRTNENGFDM